MREWCTIAETVKESVGLTRDVAFFSCWRGFDISDTLGSQVVRLPDDRDLIINFQFGRHRVILRKRW